MSNAIREWYSVELPMIESTMLKDYLRKAGVYFEPSEAGHLIHFECLMTREECELVNDYLCKITGTNAG